MLLEAIGEKLSTQAFIQKFKIDTNEIFRVQYGEGTLWQDDHFEYIVQSTESYEWIHHYIIHNPLVWEKDKYFPK